MHVVLQVDMQSRWWKKETLYWNTRWKRGKKGEWEKDWKERIRLYTNVRGTNEPNDDYPQFPSVDDGGMDEKKRQPLSGAKEN